MNFYSEFLAGLQPQPTGVGVTDQQVAVAMHPGAEFGLAALALARATAGAAGGIGQLVSLGGHQGSIKALFHHPATGPHVAAGPGDLIFWLVAEGPGPIQQGLARQHFQWTVSWPGHHG